MPNVGSPNPENDVFCDVCGVVGDALEIPHYDQRVQGLIDLLGSFVHPPHEANPSLIVHPIHYVIHLEHCIGQVSIPLDECVQSAAIRKEGEALKRVHALTK